MKAVVAAFNQEKALVGAFSLIVKTDCGTDGSFYSTNIDTQPDKHLTLGDDKKLGLDLSVYFIVYLIGIMVIQSSRCA